MWAIVRGSASGALLVCLCDPQNSREESGPAGNIISAYTITRRYCSKCFSTTPVCAIIMGSSAKVHKRVVAVIFASVRRARTHERLRNSQKENLIRVRLHPQMS
jgi:hypothetical protein